MFENVLVGVDGRPDLLERVAGGVEAEFDFLQRHARCPLLVLPRLAAIDNDAAGGKREAELSAL